MKTLRYPVIVVSLVCVLSSKGAEYAGWTVGNTWDACGDKKRMFTVFARTSRFCE